jgi:hypothetical protein
MDIGLLIQNRMFVRGKTVYSVSGRFVVAKCVYMMLTD